MRKLLLILNLICIILLVGCEKKETIYELTFPDYFSTATSVKIITKESEKYVNEIYEGIDIILNDIDKVFNVQKRNDNYITEAMKINNAAGINPVKVSDNLIMVLKRAIYFSELSTVDGRALFDITIAPVWDRWNFIDNYYSFYNPITIDVPTDLDKYLDLVDYKSIKIDDENKTVFLENENMKIDFGGIAKGYAADEIRSYLLDKNIKDAVIDVGKNIIVMGLYQNKEWTVSLQTPFYNELEHEKEEKLYYYGKINLSDLSIVTSGTYEKYVMDNNGIMYHHILDPKTGFPIDNGVVSISVITNVSTDADGYSTTLFSLGLEKGMEIVNKTEGLEAIYVVKDNNNFQIYISKGLKNNFQFNEKVESLGFTYKGVVE